MTQAIRDHKKLILTLLSGALLLILAVGCTPVPRRLAENLCRRLGDRQWILETGFFAAVFFLCLVYLSADAYNPFLYFRF